MMAEQKSAFCELAPENYSWACTTSQVYNKPHCCATWWHWWSKRWSLRVLILKPSQLLFSESGGLLFSETTTCCALWQKRCMISVSANPIDTDWLRAWHSKSKACWSVETTGCCSDFTTLLWDISSKNIFRSFAFSKKYLLTTLSRRCHLLLRVFELRFCCFLRAFLIDKPLYETRKGHTLWPIVQYSAQMYFLHFFC